MNGRLLGNCQWLIALACAAVSGAQARDPIQGSEALTYSDGASSINYRLYRPAGWDAPDADFPVVLFLHGAGERGSNNTSQVTSHIQGLIDATESGEFAAYLIAPQVPTGQQWTNVPFGTGSYSNPTLTAPPISNPVRLTLDLVEQFAALEGADETRLYITGLSMGGYGTLDAIARKPGLFAAALPLSGGGNLAFASTTWTSPSGPSTVRRIPRFRPVDRGIRSLPSRMREGLRSALPNWRGKATSSGLPSITTAFSPCMYVQKHALGKIDGV